MIVLYLPALIPPAKPLGPSLNILSRALVCRSLILPRKRSSSLVFSTRNSTVAMVLV